MKESTQTRLAIAAVSFAVFSIWLITVVTLESLGLHMTRWVVFWLPAWIAGGWGTVHLHRRRRTSR